MKPCAQGRSQAGRAKVLSAGALLGACLLLFLAVAQPPPQRTIRVVMDDNYPPFVFRDSEGRLQGILVDEWRLWGVHTGIVAELHALDWEESLRRMKPGEFDVMDTLFKTHGIRSRPLTRTAQI